MVRSFFTGLRLRLLLLVLLAIVPSLGLTVYSYTELRRLSATDVKREALQLTRIAAGDQEDVIKDSRQLLFTLAQLPEVHRADSEVCSDLLTRLLNQYPQYARLGVIGRQGELLCSTPGIDGLFDPKERDFFQRVLQTRDFAIGGYREDRGRATLDVGYPVLDGMERVQAVVFASLDLNWLSQLAAEVALPEEAALIMIDRDGTILVRYPDPSAWVGREVPEASIIEVILAQQSEGTAEAYGVDGEPRLFAFMPLSGMPGGEDVYVSIGIPTAVAFAGVERILAYNLIGLGIVTAMALAAAWLGGRFFILRPVHRVLMTAERLREGDMSARTGADYGQGELGQLAYVFDEMADSLERRVAERTRELSTLYDAEREQRLQADTLLQVASAIGSTLDLDELLSRILDQLGRVVAYDSASVQLLEEGHLQVIAARGFADIEQVLGLTFSSEDGMPSWEVVGSGQPLNLADAPARYPAFRHPPYERIRGWLGVPLRVQERVAGVIALDRHRPGQYAPEAVRMAAAFADLAALALENARLYRQAEQLAVMRERQRLARDLHDSVTQSLYSLTLLAEAGQRLIQTGEFLQVEEVVGRLGEISRQALQEMRLMVYELRPLTLQREGLIGALRQRLDTVERRAGLEVDLRVEGTVDLPSFVEGELYRIVQEALNNALKHAAATSVTVQIRARDDSVDVVVADNGRGFNPDVVGAAGGIGLSSIQERVEKLGGRLTIHSEPGQGTRVRVIVGNRIWGDV